VTTAEAAAAIGSLLARYAELIDDGDFEGVGALLGDCRVLTGDGTLVATGADAIAQLYVQTTRRYEDGTPRTQHVISNLIVEPADDGPGPGDGGRLWAARSRFTVFQATDGLALAPIIAGRYRDVVHERADGTWAFVERRMAPELFGDLEHHLLFDYRR
jgi:3-phenylpropionate/cinnamic acid dioxygenase small subunit